MKKQHLIPAAVLSTFLLTTAPAMASSPIADAHLSSAGIDFSLKASLQGSLSLTVSGPGGYYTQQDFEGGQAPYLSTFDSLGQTLQAGSYTWTLTHNPVAQDDRAAAVATKALRQSGHFTIVADGSIATPNLIENLDKAQTFATDLIVQGSGCIGFDCSSSESFGSDTLRLKENNLRIHFDDTSSSASFPGNDWRIIANDSDNGGANYFAVEDATAGRQVFKVEAGAIVNALYVDAEGDVGVGTASPVVEVHAVDGNTPTFRLEQDGSSGFTPQTWDLAGNETNFFIRDVTNASKLPFRIEPGTGDNAIYIDSTGKIGFGTNSPAAGLDVRGTNAVALALTRDSGTIRFTLTDTANSSTWQLGNEASGSEFRISKDGTGNTELTVDATGNMTLNGSLQLGDTNTGGGAGTAACIDSAGKLCACGSCG